MGKTNVSYNDFLQRKASGTQRIGRDTRPDEVNPYLHPWQREIVAWAATTGRAAIWADTGLGIELKPSYWRTAVNNCRSAEAECGAPILFDMAGA